MYTYNIWISFEPLYKDSLNLYTGFIHTYTQIIYKDSFNLYTEFIHIYTQIILLQWIFKYISFCGYSEIALLRVKRKPLYLTIQILQNLK